MKRLTRHLPFAIAAIATVMGVSLALSAWATTNCYNYSGSGSCGTNQYCGVVSAPGAWYCKQLTTPYVDPGCCAYWRTVTTWSSIGGQNDPPCPCAGAPTIDITLASNTPTAVCYLYSGGLAPDNTDVPGHCAAPPTDPGGP